MTMTPAVRAATPTRTHEPAKDEDRAEGTQHGSRRDRDHRISLAEHAACEPRHHRQQDDRRQVEEPKIEVSCHERDARGESDGPESSQQPHQESRASTHGHG